jgi:hypothetical protein
MTSGGRGLSRFAWWPAYEITRKYRPPTPARDAIGVPGGIRQTRCGVSLVVSGIDRFLDSHAACVRRVFCGDRWET